MSTKLETVNVGSHKKARLPLAVLLIALVLLSGGVVGFTALGNNAGGSPLTQSLSEPLGDATTAIVMIDPGDGNLAIDRLTGDEALLAGGTLQYLEERGLPTRSLNTSSGQATLTLKANGGQPWIRLPWSACNPATTWQIHLNPDLPTDITAHSDGGNVDLNLAGMAITRLSADTGGGNVDVVLPDNMANLSVTARTGAGNVTVAIGSGIRGRHTIDASSGAGDVMVRVPDGIAARIHATAGLGQASMDPHFNQIDDNTYQSPGYDNATDKVEITINSGAGNVSVETD